jgi:hypothetical protein
MRYSRAFLLFAVLISGLFGGCASMFRGKQELEVIGSQNIQVESVHGSKLPGYSTEDGVIVHPDPAKTDSVRIVYGSKSTTIQLAKNPSAWELLDLFTYGVGFPVDDLSHSWFNYAPIYVVIDSGSHGIDSISASTQDWLGDSPGDQRPRLLLIGGLGITFQFNGNGPSFPLGSGNFPYPLIGAQAGIGGDLYKEFELFLLARSDFSYPLASNGEGESTTINSTDLCLRYFFQKNLFIQGSIGRGYATDFGVDGEIEPIDGVVPNSTSSSFNEVGAAVGWAGDISYISLQYFGGLSSFNVPDFSNVRYHTIYLNFGLNFRI